MRVPTDRKYSETHEWFLLDGDIVTMGITAYAAEELTDITFVELPEIGTSVTAGNAIGEVESVKATSELFTGVSGEIVEVNPALVDHPELVNEDAFEEAWMVKIKPDSARPLQSLMDAKEYQAFVRKAS